MIRPDSITPNLKSYLNGILRNGEIPLRTDNCALAESLHFSIFPSIQSLVYEDGLLPQLPEISANDPRNTIKLDENVSSSLKQTYSPIPTRL
jgi:hypothetical protein